MVKDKEDVVVEVKAEVAGEAVIAIPSRNHHVQKSLTQKHTKDNKEKCPNYKPNSKHSQAQLAATAAMKVAAEAAVAQAQATLSQGQVDSSGSRGASHTLVDMLLFRNRHPKARPHLQLHNNIQLQL
eukprot:9397225-Ditylum_brightwellii.AAC.1